jgi:hypothetical protein
MGLNFDTWRVGKVDSIGWAPEDVESRAERIQQAAGCSELAVADTLEAFRLVMDGHNLEKQQS